jgi:lipoate-protein ligase B
MSAPETPKASWLDVGTPVLRWAYWPRLDYAHGLALQHRLHTARRRGEIPDVLLVTEHPPTVTLGRRGSLADLPLGPGQLAPKGIALYQVGRGGRATFHGPGQLVAYPIIDIRAVRMGPKRFAQAMVEAAVAALQSIGVEAGGGTTEPGVWVRGRKIGAVGIEILGGITRHGLSLNLGGRLEPFEFIVQCGAPGTHATSVDALGIPPPRPIEVGSVFVSTLSTLLGLSPLKVDPTALVRSAG